MDSPLPVREPSVSEVKSELQRVLASREFRQSKALSKLLRYICSKALLGDTEPITEYTIAVDVLGKPADFKESKDANVRVEVHRLRKRLADFYEKDGPGHAVRIVIPTGRYFPEFMVQNEPAVAAPEGVPEFQTATTLETMPPRARRSYWREALAGALGLCAIAVWLAVAHSPTALDLFWRPVFSSSVPILICLGNVQGGHREVPDGGQPAAEAGARPSLRDFHEMRSQLIHVDDSITLARFVGLLQSKAKPYRVESQSEATFSDFQNGPAVLIGLANNDWTGRLVDKLRFRLDRKAPRTLILRDLQHPEREDWMADYNTPYMDVTKDYALVLRVLDPKTEQMVVSAAGITVFGTLAAGEFLTNADEFRKIEAVAPKGWEKMNFEVVLSTDVIRGKSGHPQIAATHFW